MERISAHISYREATRSQTARKKGINNTPNPTQVQNMKDLANAVFEQLRDYFGTPIYISSFFRSPELNTIIGGSASSQHCANNGAAIDLDADVFGDLTNREIFEFIRGNLHYDQLIWEYGDDFQPDWVHVSFNKNKNRMENLRAVRTSRGTIYQTI